jgi:pimeloyl-ACP methyl ester carboxylesterase
VWLVDLPGYGASPKPAQDVPLAAHARTLGAVLSAAGIADPVLVGHSFGCQVVTELTRQQPGLASRLVLMAPTINPARRTRFKALADLVHDLFHEVPRAGAFGLYSYFLTGRVMYYLQQVPHMIDDAIEERLPLIDVPTLVIVGERDPLVPHPWAQRVADTLPHGRLAVVPGAHVVMYSAPDEVAALIEEHARP